MYQTITSGESFSLFSIQQQPTAHITLNRGRLKTYGDKVYLKDGSNFEIELYNPKTLTVLAKIWINGKLLSDSGIIVKPGQRVYLERFLDRANKFKFETYEVEKSKETEAAIADNGKVSVWFYDESTYFTSTAFAPIVYYGSPNTTNINQVYCTSTASFNASSGGQIGLRCQAGVDGIQMDETGRIEVGESSNQGLESVNGNFNSWTCARVELQILPESKKPIEVSSIRSYCTGCGTRHKKSTWKFCPNCGTPVNS